MEVASENNVVKSFLDMHFTQGGYPKWCLEDSMGTVFLAIKCSRSNHGKKLERTGVLVQRILERNDPLSKGEMSRAMTSFLDFRSLNVFT